MRTITSIALLVLVPVFFSSCNKVTGSGEMVSQTRNLTGFTKIALSMGATVILTNGPDNSVEVLAQMNLLPYIETIVNDGELTVKLHHGVYLGPHDPIRILVTAPDISKLTVSGSGDIQVSNEWQGNSLDLAISGSGNISMLSMAANSLNATISGSGNMEVSGGTVGEGHLKISGSGTISLQGVSGATVHTNISGSGDIYTLVNELLDAGISGSGNVYYYGNPQVNAHVSGSGTVKKLG